MTPSDLVFWIAPLDATVPGDARLLCQRHADAMVVPRGWTLDDRRENSLRLFATRVAAAPPVHRAPRPVRTRAERPEQLQIDGTGEIERPHPAALPPQADEPAPSGDADLPARRDAGPASGGAERDARDPDDPDVAAELAAPWRPDFDPDDDLDGLLEVSTPLLARAFRGASRPR